MGRRPSRGAGGKPGRGRGKPPGARVEFDESDRAEYLTGFHKRKQLRRKKADVEKKHKDRSKRLRERKELRNALERGTTAAGDEGPAEAEGGASAVAKQPVREELVTEEYDDVVVTVAEEDGRTG